MPESPCETGGLCQYCVNSPVDAGALRPAKSILSTPPGTASFFPNPRDSVRIFSRNSFFVVSKTARSLRTPCAERSEGTTSRQKNAREALFRMACFVVKVLPSF